MTTGACLLATLLAQSAAAHAEPAPSPAHADVELPRIAILVGAGMRQIWLRNDHVYPASQKADAIGLVTMVGVRVSPRVALGVHVGASQTGDSMEFRGNTTSES